MSTEELAKVTYSSPATIVRLSKKTGAKNYNHFKILFLEEYLETEKLDELLEAEPLNKKSSITEIMHMLPNLYEHVLKKNKVLYRCCLLYTSPSPRDRQKSRMPSSA